MEIKVLNIIDARCNHEVHTINPNYWAPKLSIFCVPRIVNRLFRHRYNTAKTLNQITEHISIRRKSTSYFKSWENYFMFKNPSELPVIGFVFRGGSVILSQSYNVAVNEYELRCKSSMPPQGWRFRPQNFSFAPWWYQIFREDYVFNTVGQTY